MASSIRISINDDIERILEHLKRDYPALDYPELFKLGLSELYRKGELEARARWAASLPELELSDEARTKLTEALDEADQEVGKRLSLNELKEELKDGK